MPLPGCCRREKDEEQSENLENAGSSFSASADRKCTDVFFIVVFGLFCVAWLAICLVGYAKGMPERLIYGTDHNGNVCGYGDFKDQKNIYYPRITEDLNWAYQQVGCPFDPSCGGNPFDIPFYGVCVEDCPMLADGEFVEEGGESAGSPWVIPMDSVSVLYRCLSNKDVDETSVIRCVNPESGESYSCGNRDCDDVLEDNEPDCITSETYTEKYVVKEAEDDPIYDMLNSGGQLVARWIGDVEKSEAAIMVCGGFVALAASFVWIILLKRFAKCMVWSTIIFMCAILLAVTIFLCDRGGLLDRYLYQVQADEAQPAELEASDMQDYYAYAAYFFIAADICVLLALIFLRSRIAVAIGIVKEAANALGAMPTLVLSPLCAAGFMIVGLAIWVWFGMYIASAENITTSDITESFQDSAGGYNITVDVPQDDIGPYLMLYHLFGLLWVNQLVAAVLMCTVAGAVCEWYFTMDKNELKSSPVWRSFKRTMKYHFGSLALGSLIVAIVQLMRIVAEYMDQKTKQLQDDNKIIKMLMCCVRVYLWCFEKCLKFISFNAYIVIAMKGCNFCSAMKRAFELVLGNLASVATVNIISSYLILMGKVGVVGLAMLSMFVMIDDPPTNMPETALGDLDQISSPIFPLLVTGIMAYGVATGCLAVFSMSIDTILLCYCDDQDTGGQFAGDGLRKYLADTKSSAFSHYQSVPSSA